MLIAKNADRKNALRRRRSKNSGGGIAPTAMAALIEGAFCSVNAFRHPQASAGQLQNADKSLMRLNFRYAPGNGWQRLGAFSSEGLPRSWVAGWAPLRRARKRVQTRTRAVSASIEAERNGLQGDTDIAIEIR
jgi:hypothetical protein